MINLDKPLEAFTTDELEALRITWLEQVEALIKPLMPALIANYRAAAFNKLGRDYTVTREGLVWVQTYKGSGKWFDAHKDYSRSAYIAIFVEKEQVANLQYQYFDKTPADGNWVNLSHHFARPHEVINWVETIKKLVIDWQNHQLDQLEDANFARKNQLLRMLERGDYK